MRKFLTLTLLASTVGACKSTQKSTQKIQTNKKQEIKKEIKKPIQKIESIKSNTTYFFGDYHIYEALHNKITNNWWSAFQDLKSASSSDLRSKEDALLLAVKKAAKGKDPHFGNRETIIPKARQLQKNLETKDAKLKTAILKQEEEYSKLNTKKISKKYPSIYNKGVQTYLKKANEIDLKWKPLMDAWKKKYEKAIKDRAKAETVAKAKKLYQQEIYAKTILKLITSEIKKEKSKFMHGPVSRAIKVAIIRIETLQEMKALKKAREDIFSTVPTEKQ